VVVVLVFVVMMLVLLIIIIVIVTSLLGKGPFFYAKFLENLSVLCRHIVVFNSQRVHRA